jgi:chemotaxis protein methyltransferase CheR
MPGEPPPRRAASPAAAVTASHDLVEAAAAGLAALVGLAPSEVLRRRIARCAGLLPALRFDRPDIDDPAWATVIDAVTVQETRLFRHPALLAVLEAAVLPVLRAAAEREGQRPLRLVSAGCATGEEAYTLAMLALNPHGGGPRCAEAAEVLGLDLSRPALTAAEAAAYPLGAPDPARDVPARHRALLEERGGVLRPVAPVRAAVRFARANLLAPPAAATAEADLVMCRNVLIYLEREARAAVVAHLIGALRPGGSLVLGPTDAPPPGLPLAPWDDGLVGVWRRVAAHG